MDRETVLFANEAFYRAFADRDMAAMDALWAREAPVACIHPGWGLLDSREAVMESWRGILGSGSAPDIRCRRARAFILGDAAFVTCFEAVGADMLIATNVFVRERSGWKMVHHQAGPTAERPGDDDAPAPDRVH